jgi:hypothetical protein
MQGTPAADILSRGPPLPLIIDRLHCHDITTQDKEDILLALKHRDRIRRIRLQICVPDLETHRGHGRGVSDARISGHRTSDFTLYKLDASINLSCTTSTPPYAIGYRLPDSISITNDPR